MITTGKKQKRVDRVTYLNDRLRQIPDELDELDEKLYIGFLTRRKFMELVDHRNALMEEEQKRKTELSTLERVKS